MTGSNHCRLTGWCGIVLLSAILQTPTTPARADTTARHLPPADTTSGTELRLEATVQRDWESDLFLMYRAGTSGPWVRLAFHRADDIYVAVIPASAVVAPSLEYFIVGQAPRGRALPQFASAQTPHRVLVYDDAEAVRTQRELARVRQRRARLGIFAEYVDYGTRTIGDEKIPDRYTRIELDFSYRLLRHPLHTLRFGYTRLVGTTPIAPIRLDEESTCSQDEASDGCSQEAGFRTGGWAELSFRIVDGVAIDTRGMVQATQSGFGLGFRGEGRIGEREQTHVALGLEYIGGNVGTSYFFRLGWDTVPLLPMAATIEVTDLPADHRAHAVRLLYDIAYPMENGFRVGLRAGYQARNHNIGGFTAGGTVALDF